MKDSLHFILLGVLGLLGIVMMAVGVLSKTGAEEKLNQSAAQVEGALKSGVPTAGDIKAVEGSQQKFVSEVKGMEDALVKGTGAKLFEFTKTFTSSDDFNTEVASKEIPALKGRFARLKNVSGIPEKLAAAGGRFQEEDESENFWIALQGEMSRERLQAAEIPKAQARLKVIREVCIACEKLLSSAEFKGSSFLFRKFEFGAFNQEAASDPKEAWLKHEFTFSFDADPAFSLALLDALLSPTEATVGTGDGKRDGLPFALVSLMGVQPERVHVAQYKVTNAERGAWEIPKDWLEDEEPNRMDENGSSGKRAAVAADLEKKLVFSHPLRYDLKLYALRANPDWKAIAKPAATAAE